VRKIFLSVPAAVLILTACSLRAADQGSAEEAKATNSAAAVESAITADRIDFDNKEGVILFDRNVLVSDPQFTMRSDRLIVFLQGTNDVDQIMAIGNVSLTNENRSAKCDKAVYTRKDGQIVMTGNVVLRQGGDKRGEVSGSKMAIWLNEERMEILEGGRVTLPPDTFKKVDALNKVDNNLVP
jgi:lipopolysaccharide export system protein LptA